LAKASVGLLTVNVPDVAPTLIAVAAPAKLTVVALALTRAKVDEPVVNDVVIFGLVPKTATPVPVASVRVLRRTDDAAE